MEDIKEQLEKYPFLQPRNVFSDELTVEKDSEEYYAASWWSQWDSTGWEKIWKEYLKELCAHWETWDEEAREKFRLFDSKEKWGALRIDTSFGDDFTHKLEWKYEMLSEYTCIKCGKQPRDSKGNRMIWKSKGWIAPFCKECAKKQFKHDGEYITYKKGITWKNCFTRDVHEGRFSIKTHFPNGEEKITYFDEIQ